MCIENLYPALYPTLFPTQTPTDAAVTPDPTPDPTPEPTPVPEPTPAPEPTPDPTETPTGLPVVGDTSAAVCAGETTIIFGVLDGAVPGAPLPNSVSLSGIVTQGAPVRRALQEEEAWGGLKSVDGSRCELAYAAG